MPEDLLISSSFIPRPFPCAWGCRPGWMEGGQEMKGVDVGAALLRKPHTTELPHSQFGH